MDETLYSRAYFCLVLSETVFNLSQTVGLAAFERAEVFQLDFQPFRQQVIRIGERHEPRAPLPEFIGHGEEPAQETSMIIGDIGKQGGISPDGFQEKRLGKNTNSVRKVASLEQGVSSLTASPITAKRGLFEYPTKRGRKRGQEEGTHISGDSNADSEEEKAKN